MLLSSIRYKLLLSFVVFIMLPILITVMVYYEVSKQLLVHEINQTNAEVLGKITERINTTAERIVKASHLIVNDPDVLDLIRNDHDIEINDYPTFQKYLGVNKKITNIRDFLLESEAYVAVLDFKGHMYSTWTSRNAAKSYQEFQKEPWFQQTQMATGTPIWQLAYTNNIENDYVPQNTQLFIMTRLIKSDTGKGYGIVFIGVPIQAVLPEIVVHEDVNKSTTQMTPNQLFLMQNHNLMLGSKELFSQLSLDSLNPDTTTRAGYLINQSMVKQLGWELVSATPQKQFTGQLQALRNKSIVWLTLLFLFFCILFILVMFKVIKPIKILHRSMVKVGNGDFASIADIQGNDEIATLSHKFNAMVLNLRKLIERLSEEQQRKEEARFQALQAQVKPHFLFNTLNSIKWTARLSGAEHVSQMITSLGKLLSYAMNNDREVTILKEELDFLQSYVNLQNVRFNNEVSLDIRVPEVLLEAKLLKFTLQPLVENSIIHGKRSPLSITIEAYIDQGDLLIVVKDNGIGNQRPLLESVEDKQLTSSKFSGIGLNNINDRLKMHFGEAYGLTFESGETEGVVVTVRIPFLKGDIQHDSDTDRG
ncbi:MULTISPECIES: sensor histidine kinase [unclassified Paenibacillus]|uniref:sensor histidine kinase n=1 Tax=unclassified Paenibacillus TaxID=185978 RepID=UPI00362FCA6E